jgi:hypothetical protein
MQPSLTLPFLLSIKSSLELLKTALIKAIKKFSSAIPTQNFGVEQNLQLVSIE